MYTAMTRYVLHLTPAVSLVYKDNTEVQTVRSRTIFESLIIKLIGAHGHRGRSRFEMLAQMSYRQRHHS